MRESIVLLESTPTFFLPVAGSYGRWSDAVLAEQGHRNTHQMWWVVIGLHELHRPSQSSLMRHGRDTVQLLYTALKITVIHGRSFSFQMR